MDTILLLLLCIIGSLLVLPMVTILLRSNYKEGYYLYDEWGIWDVDGQLEIYTTMDAAQERIDCLVELGVIDGEEPKIGRIKLAV